MYQIGIIVGPDDPEREVIVTVLAVTPEMNDVLNIPDSVTVCGGMVIVPPLPSSTAMVDVNPPAARDVAVVAGWIVVVIDVKPVPSAGNILLVIE